eukprot:scaffold173702_cov20-Tisochrysis_lutea.AAC.1
MWCTLALPWPHKEKSVLQPRYTLALTVVIKGAVPVTDMQGAQPLLQAHKEHGSSHRQKDHSPSHWHSRSQPLLQAHKEHSPSHRHKEHCPSHCHARNITTVTGTQGAQPLSKAIQELSNSHARSKEKGTSV